MVLVVATTLVTDCIIERPHFHQVFLFDISQVCDPTEYLAGNAKTRPTAQSRTFGRPAGELCTNEVFPVIHF